MAHRQKVSVIVVTYDGWSLLSECLGSLMEQTLAATEIIVVDNGSRDGTLAQLAQRFPSVRSIDAGTNRGFAAGNNLGIAASTSDIVVLLNNDTLAEAHFLSTMVAPFEDDPRLGSIAATMVFASNPDVIASAGIDMHRNGLALDRGLGTSRDDLVTPAPVFGPSAGAAAYRRTALDDAGWFPEHFFMYLEDVDLAWRLQLRGWRSLHAPAAVVRHAYSASSVEGSSFKRRLLARNRIWMMARCLPTWFLRRHWSRIATYESLVLAFAALRRDPDAIRGRLEGFRGLNDRLKERARIQRRSRVLGAELSPLVLPDLPAREIVRLRRLSAAYALPSVRGLS